MNTYQFEIAAGKLAIETQQELVQLPELLDFASRQNPNRSFLFVSKVLGKYIPIRPHTFRSQCERLVSRLPLFEQSVTVMGLAETATGLGHGVYAALKDRQAELNAFYCHSTRCQLPGLPLALQFEESHSHAVDHLVYEPLPAFQPIFQKAKALVLVDDEITTGRTLERLAKAYIDQNPNVEQVYFVTLVSWLSPERKREIADKLGCDLQISALLKGRFSFHQNPQYFKQFPKNNGAVSPSLPGRQDLGRRGILDPRPMKYLPQLDEKVLVGKKLLVLGTGECNYFPFLLAESLEKKGHDVLFLSTGQSPMIVDGAIKSKIEVQDHHQRGLRHYLYNLPLNRHIIIVYESEEMMKQHQLPTSLSAQKVHLNHA